MIYQLGSFSFDLERGLLSRDGEPVRIPAKTLEVLGALVENHDRVINRDELMSRVWPDLFVEEANLSVHIFNLRKLFKGEDAGDVRIETYPKQGYRLTGVKIAESHLSAPEHRPARSSHMLNLAVVGLSSVAVIFLAVSMLKPGNGAQIGTVKMTRVPSTENTISLAISPDGQYMAHVLRQGNKRSLRLRNLRSGEERELVAPEPVDFGPVMFSRDGNEIMFNRRDTIFAIPATGGEERMVLSDVDGTIAFSPKSDEIAFVRRLGQNSVLMISSAAGGNERQVAVRAYPEYFYSDELSWSPDGNRLAAAAGTARGERKTLLVAVETSTGEISNLSEKKFTGMDGLVWLPDGSGLVFGGFETTTAKTRIWFLPTADGVPRQLTNDDNNYGGVSVTADGRTVLTGQFRQDSSVWMDREDQEPAQPVSLEKHHEFQFISWTRANQILFGSSSMPDRDVWVMNADGSNPHPLTSGSRNNLMPVASPDGRYVVFASNRAATGAYNIWRMNSDGSEPTQLTFGDGEIQPVVSADSKWVFYTSGAPDTPSLERRIWKVPIDGGSSEQVVDLPSQWADVSPDGKFLAFAVKQGDRAPWKAAVLSLESGAMSVLELTPNNPIRWTPDGKSISFVKAEADQDVSNIWTFPIAGGEPKKVTNFVTHFVINHDWSPDGRLFCSRSRTIRDAFLITDFR